jgi:hypothetical protein
MAAVAADGSLARVMPVGRGGRALALVVSERRGPYRAPGIAAGGSSVNTGPRRHRPGGAAVSTPVGLHLKPGQKGTKHLVEQYGDRLVCVRYRYGSIQMQMPAPHPHEDAGLQIWRLSINR